jgi:UTP--glucose-1-phosphate uridylyltransferase
MTDNSIHLPVTRALIPCGGRGTRMLALTQGAPKELLKVGGVPAIIRVLTECRESGIADVVIVIAPDKTAIVDTVKSRSGTAGMPERISFVVQDEPRGLADAIRLGRDFAAGEPLAVALPDNLFTHGAPAVRQVADTCVKTGMNVVGVVEISGAEASKRGPTSVYSGMLTGDDYSISRLPGKGERGKTFDTQGAASAFTGIGRFVFTSDGFDAIETVAANLPPGAELDDVPVMQLLLEKGRLIGRRISGRFYDIGLVPGFNEADEAFSENPSS